MSGTFRAAVKLTSALLYLLPMTMIPKMCISKNVVDSAALNKVIETIDAIAVNNTAGETSCLCACHV